MIGCAVKPSHLFWASNKWPRAERKVMKNIIGMLISGAAGLAAMAAHIPILAIPSGIGLGVFVYLALRQNQQEAGTARAKITENDHQLRQALAETLMLALT